MKRSISKKRSKEGLWPSFCNRYCKNGTCGQENGLVMKPEEKIEAGSR